MATARRWRLPVSLILALWLTFSAATLAHAQTEPGSTDDATRTGCASFDDLAPGATYGPGAVIESGESISLKVGQAVSAESKATVGESITGQPGNSLGIIAVLIGLVSGNPGPREIEFLYRIDEGPVQLRVNGQTRNLPGFEALDGHSVGGVRIAVDPSDPSGNTVYRMRATGPIATFAVGGKALAIDDLCITLPGAPPYRAMDLGDAPDGTNHWGAAMTAYPAIAARFPTVYDPAVAPVGPAHRAPLPFHLGASVSREANADWGPDADFVNNIVPPTNTSDRDRFDDGLNPALIPFAECTRPQFPVRVYISAAAIAALPNGVGYLNVWVDGNRDGDWEDNAQCTTASGAVVPAREHFVVDFQVNAAALGVGLHTINVASNQAVLWPSGVAAKPAWLRATLSDAPSVKPPAASVGDGRGPTPPFALGETEDYIWRSASDPANGPDVAVTNRGKAVVRPALGNQQGAFLPGVQVMWWIDYRNLGRRVATNVLLTDDLVDAALYGDALVIRTSPAISYTREVNKVIFQVGDLPPGAGGRILIGARLPVETLGEPLVNKVAITAALDADPANNSAEATIRPLLPAPFILWPGNGTTNRGEVTVRGLAWGAGAIDLYADGAKLATIAVSDGKWSYDATLADGDYRLIAFARQGSLTSKPSNLVELTVDSTLGWDPLSLRIQGPNGYGQRPTDEQGRTDADGWRIWLRPSTPYTVSMRLCNNEVIEGTFSIGDQQNLVLTDTVANGRYAAQFVSPATVSAPLTATVDVACASASLAQTSAETVSTARVGGGLASRMGTIRVLNAVTLEPVANADILGTPTYTSWWGCLTCTVAAGAPNASGNDVAMEELVLTVEAVEPPTEEVGFVFHTITWLKVAAPGYQPFASLVNLDFARVGGGIEVHLLPEITEAPNALLTLSDDEGIDSPFILLKGQVVRILNVGSAARTVNVLGDGSVFAAEGSAGKTTFDTGTLVPGQYVDLVVDGAGTLTLADASDPTLTRTIQVLDLGAPPLYLPVVVK